MVPGAVTIVLQLLAAVQLCRCNTCCDQCNMVCFHVMYAQQMSVKQATPHIVFVALLDLLVQQDQQCKKRIFATTFQSHASYSLGMLRQGE